MLLPRLVLVAAHYLCGRILRGCVQDVRDDQPYLPRLLRTQLPLPNPSKSRSTDSVISAMVLPENIKGRQVHHYLPTLLSVSKQRRLWFGQFPVPSGVFPSSSPPVWPRAQSGSGGSLDRGH